MDDGRLGFNAFDLNFSSSRMKNRGRGPSSGTRILEGFDSIARYNAGERAT
jgi:hypothetical protein